MRTILYMAVTTLLFACGSATTEAPTSLSPADAFRNSIKGKRYEVKDVGFVAIVMGEKKPIQWSAEIKDTSKYYRDFIAAQKKFSLSFINDSTVKWSDENKTADALYELTMEAPNTILLNIKMEDPELSFPGTGPMLVTHIYRVRNNDSTTLILETPRSFKQQEVMVLMEQK